MRKRNFISGIVLLALAGAIMMEAGKLSFGSLREPEAGFLPFILSVLLTVFSLILLGQSIKEKKDEEEVSFEMKFGNWKRIGLAMGVLLFFTFFVERLGYLISSFFLVAFLLRAIEPQKWWLVIGIAFLSSLGSYVLFVLCLGTPLPEGMFGF